MQDLKAKDLIRSRNISEPKGYNVCVCVCVCGVPVANFRLPLSHDGDFNPEQSYHVPEQQTKGHLSTIQLVPYVITGSKKHLRARMQ